MNLIKNAIASEWFFSATLTIFLLQATWLAVSAVYPLPFDEYYHVQFTQIYTEQWSPIISEQPSSASILGDITRRPNYIYSYFLSMPYRLFATITNDPMTSIVLLRLTNIAMVVLSLVFFRKFLDKIKLTRTKSHIILAVFASTPIVPFLAAHVNYDNMLLMLVPLYFILFVELFVEKLNVQKILLFISLGLLMCLVKINAAPIFAVTTLIVAARIWKQRAQTPLYFKHWAQGTSTYIKTATLLFLLITGLLFTERFAGNMFVYQTIDPGCDTIQNTVVCSKNAPWYRNNNAINEKWSSVPLYGNPVSYTQHWISTITRGYFSIFSHNPSRAYSSLEPFGPIEPLALLPIPIAIAGVSAVILILAFLIQIKKLIRIPTVQLLLILIVSLIVPLWATNFIGYLHLGRAYAIQARYTLFIIVPLLALFTITFNNTPKALKKQGAILFSLLLVLYTYSGGISGYIIRANNGWYSQNEFIITANSHLKTILKKVVIH